MKCKICKKEFTPKFSRAVTCGDDECKKANYIFNRDKKNGGGVEQEEARFKNEFLLSGWCG